MGSCVAVCACGFYAKANVCIAVTGCTGKTDGTVNRAEDTAPSATADTICTACASGFWAAGNGDCAAHSKCYTSTTNVGCQADKTIRAAAKAGTATADAVCDACTGAFGANIGDCTACDTVSGAASGATYTCTDNTNSRVSACATCDTTVKTVGTDSTDDTC